MLSLYTPVALIALLASSASAQFMINTPTNVGVCLPELLSWTGGTPPYFLSILPAGQPSAPALVDLGTQTGTQVTWVANLAVGVSAFLDLRDNTGALAQSGTFIISAGGNTSCVGQTPVTSGSSAGPTTAAGGSSPSTNSGSPPTTKSSTSTTAKVANPSKAAAVSQYAPVGAAALIGAALFAIVV